MRSSEVSKTNKITPSNSRRRSIRSGPCFASFSHPSVARRRPVEEAVPVSRPRRGGGGRLLGGLDLLDVVVALQHVELLGELLQPRQGLQLVRHAVPLVQVLPDLNGETRHACVVIKVSHGFRKFTFGIFWKGLENRTNFCRKMVKYRSLVNNKVNTELQISPLIHMCTAFFIQSFARFHRLSFGNFPWLVG